MYQFHYIRLAAGEIVRDYTRTFETGMEVQNRRDRIQFGFDKRYGSVSTATEGTKLEGTADLRDAAFSVTVVQTGPEPLGLTEEQARYSWSVRAVLAAEEEFNVFNRRKEDKERQERISKVDTLKKLLRAYGLADVCDKFADDAPLPVEIDLSIYFDVSVNVAQLRAARSIPIIGRGPSPQKLAWFTIKSLADLGRVLNDALAPPDFTHEDDAPPLVPAPKMLRGCLDDEDDDEDAPTAARTRA